MVQTAEASLPNVAELQDQADQEMIDQDQDEEFHSGKIYCANCIHCKVTPSKSDKDDQYVLRIRCAAGKWKKKLGEEKLYKYCTVTRRYLDVCDTYEAMGDTREFIRELRKSLSGKDEVYSSIREQEE
jgi:hypothetical protein